MAQSIREVMTTEPITLPAGSAVTDAAQAMKQNNIGNVLVLNDGNEVTGIVTDRDITLRVVAEGLDPAATKLDEICSSEILTLTPNDTVEAAIKLMKDKAIRRLPVVEGGRPVGIVSLGDLAVLGDGEKALEDISSAPADR